jgi:hypothetical protein
MSILKSFICAVLFLAHAASAEFFVNCMAAVDSDPLANGCTDVNQRVLALLDNCTDSSMQFVGRLQGYIPAPARLLRSREQRQEPPSEQSERELQTDSCGLCCNFDLSAGQRMTCCMYSGNAYSYCGSPMGGRRLDDVVIGEAVLEVDSMAAIAQECTIEFKALAQEYTDANLNCIGSVDEVFCHSVQVFAA